MEYNTQREKLKITDYGRHVAKMIEKCKGVENREERTAMANMIVEVMAHVAPKVKERTDYRHILWDHLMMMAGYELDVDCPYEISQEETENLQPNRLKYREGNITYRHYGRALEDMVKVVALMPAGEERDRLIGQIANTMKRQYLQWNSSSVEDSVIEEQMKSLSGGKIELPEGFEFQETQVYIDAMAAAVAKKEANEAKKKKKKKKK